MVETPPGILACSRCGSDNASIFLRGWSRLYAFFLWWRETRSSAYVCGSCSQKLTTFNLVVTALFGWWALQSFFWYAPKSTYLNWRAVWAAPSDPLAWGAIPLDELLDAIVAAEEQPEVEGGGGGDEEEDAPPVDSPLRRLTPAEQELVLRAPDLNRALRIGIGQRRAPTTGPCFVPKSSSGSN